ARAAARPDGGGRARVHRPRRRAGAGVLRLGVALMAAWFPTDRCLIGGEWVAAGGTLPAVDPSDGEEFGRIARGTAGEVDAAVAAARAAFEGEWGTATAAER